MFLKSRKSQAGFSLVELMVVVAIIGVLASIAVPSINKYLAKARQTEAKTQLSALYTSEKAFFAEYTAYDVRFAAVGYSPEGQLRYNIGFSGNHATANAGHGYNGSPAANFAAKGYCGAAGTLANGCTLLNGATGAAAPNIPAVTSMSNTAMTFVAAATAQISSTGAADVWTINNSKVIRNTTNGIP